MKAVRQRALLHITAICLLLAAATVSAQPPLLALPKPAAAQKPPLGKTSVLGQKRAPWETGILGQKRAPWGETTASGKNEQLAQKPAVSEKAPAVQKPAAAEKAVVPEKAPAVDKPAAAAGAAEKPKAVDKPAAVAAAAEKAAFAANPQFQLLAKVVPGLSPRDFSVVPGTVKRFATDFEAGAKNPKSYLPQVRPELLSEWKAVKQKDRIFIIGAGKDSAEVSEVAKALKAQGKSVFFYDFCHPLCSSEAVGAMFGTSGQTMLYHTSSADLSQYVTVELATARFIDGLAKPVILISTEEFLAAGAFNMHVVEMRMPTPTPSPVK